MANNVTVKTIGVYPVEQAIISAVAEHMFEGNESLATRFMIRDYARRNNIPTNGGTQEPERPNAPASPETQAA